MICLQNLISNLSPPEIDPILRLNIIPCLLDILSRQDQIPEIYKSVICLLESLVKRYPETADLIAKQQGLVVLDIISCGFNEHKNTNEEIRCLAEQLSNEIRQNQSIDLI